MRSRPQPFGRAAGVACQLLLVAALAGCGSAPSSQADGAPASSSVEESTGGTTAPAPPTGVSPAPTTLSPSESEPIFPAYGVTATSEKVDVYSGPDGDVVHTLSSPQPSGAPLTFLLDSRDGDWLKVLLPVRPNGSTGWIRAGDGEVLGLPYRIDVSRGEHVVRLYRFGELVETYPAGIGTQNTPTPGGTFYLKELLAPTNEDGAYGPYAYGLSGFSTTLDSFAGGDAVIGLHGTNAPSSVGRDVSSGCIRLRNEDITALAGLLPLGTPVHILA